MSIKSTNGYEIHVNKQARHRNNSNGVILTHLTDLLDAERLTNPSLRYDMSDKNQYNESFFYFKKDLGFQHYGFHIFFETYYNEIFNYLGCSFSNRSEYLIDLVKREILNSMYQDYLLVVISGNYEDDLCEKKMYSKVAYQVAGIMNYEHLKLDKLFYLSDIIDEDKAKKSPYLFSPMTHFNRNLFYQELVRFKDK